MIDGGFVDDIGNMDLAERSLDERIELLCAWMDHATSLLKSGDYESAVAVYEQAERACRRSGYREGILLVALGHAFGLCQLHDLSGLEAVRRECAELVDDRAREIAESGATGRLAAAQQRQLELNRETLAGVDELLKTERERQASTVRPAAAAADPDPQPQPSTTPSERAPDRHTVPFDIESVDMGKLDDEQKRGLIVAWTAQADNLVALGDFDAALAMHRRSEALCHRFAFDSGLCVALNNEVAVHVKLDDMDAALAVLVELEGIYRDARDDHGLQSALGKRGLIQHQAGDTEGALASLMEQERLCRALGDDAALQDSLTNQALVRRAAELASQKAAAPPGEPSAASAGLRSLAPPSASIEADPVERRFGVRDRTSEGGRPMGMTFPADFADAVGIDSLLDKYFPSGRRDAEFRDTVAMGGGCFVMDELMSKLRGRHGRKGAGLVLEGDYEALWALEVRRIPNAAEVARDLMEEHIRRMSSDGS